MKTGTRFTLYGFAKCGDQYRGIANRREKCDVASRVIRDRWLSVTWPATVRGAEAATDWSSRTNMRSNGRYRSL